MSYTVEVEKNYEPFKKCLMNLMVSRGQIHSLPGYYLELARVIEEQFNIKCNLINVDGALVWETLEFENEQEYLIWLLKYA